MKREGGLVSLWAAAGLVCLAAACGRGSDHPSVPSSTSMAVESSPMPSQPTSNASPTMASPPPAADADSSLTIQGWLTIVWNDQAHFFLTDDEGNTHELLLDESLTGPLGGPLALDRKRVAVTAVVVKDRPDVLQVLSIARESEE